MDTPIQAWILPVCQLAAFWVAVLTYRGEFPLRFVLGLGLGALLARLGWGLLHWPQLFPFVWPPAGGLEGVRSLLQWFLPGSGFSLLFVPLGPLLVVPWRRGIGVCTRFGAAAGRSLAPAFAVARLGCVLAGCCPGLPMDAAVGGRPLYPTTLFELLGWGLTSLLVARVPDHRVPGLLLLAFGGLRLITEPWRAPPPLGDPVIDPGWIAVAWFAAGLGLARTRPEPSRLQA